MEIKIRGKTALFSAVAIVAVALLAVCVWAKAAKSENSNSAVLKNAENYITTNYPAEDYTFEPDVAVTAQGGGVYQVDGSMFDGESAEHSFTERLVVADGRFSVEELLIDNDAVAP